jgi:hypothetical protein
VFDALRYDLTEPARKRIGAEVGLSHEGVRKFSKLWIVCTTEVGPQPAREGTRDCSWISGHATASHISSGAVSTQPFNRGGTPSDCLYCGFFGRSLASGVQLIFDQFSRTEPERLARGDIDAFAGVRVTPRSSFTCDHVEDA